MRSKIKHLYARAGFGLSPEEWRQRREWSIDEGVDQLFAGAAAARGPRDGDTPDIDPQPRSEEDRQRQRRLVARENIEWIQRMARPGGGDLVERMALFWHGHFACRTLNSQLAAAQLQTLRRYGLGNFRELVLAIARDVAMIRYLNNQQNRKQHPNENFARELMELFTIGRGHYGEKDVREAARAFTGWSSNIRGEFVFRSFWHDYGSKTFMGKTGRFNGEDIIDIILERQETADFITKKIYRYFVGKTPHPEIAEELSHRFYRSGYEIGPLMAYIFRSDWFYAPSHVGSKYKSPVELLAGIMRTLNLSVDPALMLLPVQQSLGQVLFSPPNVAGWPGGPSWIDNSTLTLRLGLPVYILGNEVLDRRPKAGLKEEAAAKKIGRLRVAYDLEPLKRLVEGKGEEEAFATLTEYLLPVAPSVDLGFLQRYACQQEAPLKVLLGGLMSLPEYQMC
jgi:uncharacterized protein (DUF1800 family)